MSKIPVRVLVCAVLIVGWISNARSQDSTDKPLGDSAREQREFRQTPKYEKVYENRDVEPSPSPHRFRDGATSSESTSKPQTQPQEPAPATTPAESRSTAREPYELHRVPKRSVLDHRIDEDDAEDKLIVPEGTELKVEIPAVSNFPDGIYTGKVAAPVRIDFATAIPALSVVSVKAAEYHSLYDGDYSFGYFEALEVTQLVVDGVPYSVQTDRVGRPSYAAAPSEVTF